MLLDYNAYVGADLVRFKAEVHFDGMELTRLYMKTINLEKALEVCICIAQGIFPTWENLNCIQMVDTNYNMTSFIVICLYILTYLSFSVYYVYNLIGI